MALPATNIQLSAVNTELGNTSTASIDLNTPRVRSLGGVSTTSTAFSMSSFASKSGTWAIITDSSIDLTDGNSSISGFAIPATSQNFIYRCFSPSISSSPYRQAMIEKRYVNGGIVESFAFSGTNISVRDIAASFDNSYIYLTVDGPNYPLVKMNTTGNSVVASAKYSISGGSIVHTTSLITVDSSDNCYIAAARLDPINFDQVSTLFSVDSSLTPRWGAIMPYVPGVNVARIYGIKLDGSGNLYAQINHYQNTAPSGDAGGYIKYSSAGTELTRNFRYSTNTSIAVEWYGTPGVNSSGAVSITGCALFYAVTMYFDSSGTYQWSRALNDTSGNAYFFTPSWSTVDASGNVYSLFSIQDNSTSTGYSVLVKYNSSGVLQWQRTFYQNFSPSWILWPAYGDSTIVLTGTNQSIISINFTIGFYGDMGGSFLDPCTISVQADGSGTGTYPVTVGSYTFSISYQPSTYTDAAFSTTATTRSFSTTSATPVVTGTNLVTTETPFTLSRGQVNI